MSSRQSSRKRTGLIGLLVAAVTVLSAYSPAVVSAGPTTSGCSATPDKCFSFAISGNPASPVQGHGATWTGVLKNLSKGSNGLQLGSANLTLDPGFTSIVATGTSVGTESVAGNVVQLRGLALAANKSVTFTFTANSPNEAGSCMFSIEAKQSNDFNGSGNNLSNVAGNSCSNVPLSSSCALLTSYDSCGTSNIDESVGGTTQSANATSAGGISSVRMTITYAPIAVPPGTVFLSQVHTELGGNICLLVACHWLASVDNKISADYTIERNAITLTVTCGSVCGPLDPLYQYEDSTQQVELLPPCLGQSKALVPSLLSGSWACHEGLVVKGLSNVNDYKVMG